MKNLLDFILVAAAGMLVVAREAQARQAATIEWHPWSEAVFEEAKRENRFVLLDLGAGWCHWCHVMDDVTYRDPEVIALVNAHYLPVRVDQDSRPDLANRYEDYGWPATIVFNSGAGEIVKRQGYIPPRPMASMLRAIIDDPTPGPSVVAEKEITPASEASLPAGSREALRKRLLDAYDRKNLGWGTVHKFLDWDVIEYCIDEARRGDRQLERMARDTLGAQLNLMDPVWGGVYQYSTHGDWHHPHYEKIMQFQAENLRTYAIAYALWGDPVYLRAAERIRSYIENFLMSPQGAFYTSQDADLVPGEHSTEYFAMDDAARRKMGIPRIDMSIYSRENGWAINALATLFAVTGVVEYRNEAVRAAHWIIAHRAMPQGGFRHDERVPAGPYLSDTLAMGRAFLTLYAVTGDRSWLDRAAHAAEFINATFKSETGYATSSGEAALSPKPQLDENVSLARFANLLHHYTGNARNREIAEHAMRYLAAPGVAQRRGFQVAGILLADRELYVPPLHITVVGSKNDSVARSLFFAAVRQPVTYKRVEWSDPSEGPLPNADVEYPRLQKPAAFLCTDRTCSAPIFSPDKLEIR